jgi:hypothetical protein
VPPNDDDEMMAQYHGRYSYGSSLIGAILKGERTMKIYVDREVKTLKGGAFDPPVTLREALYNAITCPTDFDRGSSLKEKLELHRLGKRITSEGDQTGVVELSAQEMSKIQERVNAAFSSNQFVGQVCEMLEDGYTPPVP